MYHPITIQLDGNLGRLMMEFKGAGEAHRNSGLKGEDRAHGRHHHYDASEPIIPSCGCAIDISLVCQEYI
jgi:hypothetical protein